ncbi:ATP-binding protein [Streptomyces sp. NBC_00053]|uniref:ATP-binding protein n=1 Tax=unclassified Streptomyces TaxID=2593676 RepID=UPI0022573AEC|nr:MULTISPECIES: ATP-binding protein [unclassified Streptomyces]MCX5103054.1 ATP-binding protein [Streptomyces sp. NBC_00439]MCX5106656.1 ATP-binding protein [Streptomyces sp. NBC_00439]MCX5505483.1 ATP-binding protein [Streptomyces sp. NBC_00052]MCX5545977.1 ATP-binding protein [Streptomyces sp. NBC_00051]
MPALFEPFQRGREHRSDGTGLGLAVVRAITLTHHGELTATPRPDGGLTVRVELPTTQMEQVPQSPASENPTLRNI